MCIVNRPDLLKTIVEKKALDGYIFSICSRRGHDDTDCWAKQKEERVQNVRNDQQVNLVRGKENKDGLAPGIGAAVRQGGDGGP